MEITGTQTVQLAGERSLSGLSAKPKDTPAKIKEAAVQFEALLMGQILKSMREASSGGLGGEETDASSTSMLEMADEQFARALSARGGLGIARLVAKGLEPRPTPPAVDSTTGSSTE